MSKNHQEAINYIERLVRCTLAISKKDISLAERVDYQRIASLLTEAKLALLLYRYEAEEIFLSADVARLPERSDHKGDCAEDPGKHQETNNMPTYTTTLHGAPYADGGEAGADIIAHTHAEMARRARHHAECALNADQRMDVYDDDGYLAYRFTRGADGVQGVYID